VKGYSNRDLGSPYANFAGHDASRGLAKNSFDVDMMVDPHGPIDKLEDLEASDWESLREWVKKKEAAVSNKKKKLTHLLRRASLLVNTSLLVNW
jgi:hypothetical protein